MALQKCEMETIWCFNSKEWENLLGVRGLFVLSCTLGNQQWKDERIQDSTVLSHEMKKLEDINEITAKKMLSVVKIVHYIPRFESEC